MDQSKPWWQSQGIWGSVVVVLAAIAALFNIDFDESMKSQLTEILVGGSGLAGGIIAFIGRIKATKKIG